MIDPRARLAATIGPVRQAASLLRNRLAGPAFARRARERGAVPDSAVAVFFATGPENFYQFEQWRLPLELVKVLQPVAKNTATPSGTHRARALGRQCGPASRLGAVSLANGTDQWRQAERAVVIAAGSDSSTGASLKRRSSCDRRSTVKVPSCATRWYIAPKKSRCAWMDGGRRPRSREVHGGVGQRRRRSPSGRPSHYSSPGSQGCSQLR